MNWLELKSYLWSSRQATNSTVGIQRVKESYLTGQSEGEIMEGFLNEESLIDFSNIGRPDVGGKAMWKKKQHE